MNIPLVQDNFMLGLAIQLSLIRLITIGQEPIETTFGLQVLHMSTTSACMKCVRVSEETDVCI